MKSKNEYHLYDDPMEMYQGMLKDIQSAKTYVYIEVYRFHNETIGNRFRDALTEAAKRGVKVKILMDSWGTSLPRNFFEDMVANGGEVRYFKKIQFVWDFFSRNHRRNHRKMMVIDDETCYIGSANLSNYSLNWRESMLRVKSKLALVLKEIFVQDFESHDKYLFEKIAFTRDLKTENCKVIRDVPSVYMQKIKDSIIEIIHKSKEEITIETPYFLPGQKLRKALIKAVERGVKVNVIIPKDSDVGLVDLLRNRYLGKLYNLGVNFFFYLPYNLHAKLLLSDNQTFVLGSANFDERSFKYQHELVVVCEHPDAIRLIKAHIAKTLEKCETFDYQRWEKRSKIQKWVEVMLLPFKHLL